VIDVPYLSEERIEREADVLLSQFHGAGTIPLAPPIPVDDILEAHLQLTLELGDLHARLGVPVVGGTRDLLGALWVDERSVFIDHTLDPHEQSWREGRYRFTVAHEIGHWQVHREYLPSHLHQPSLFHGDSEPTIVCRKSQAKERIEWQADFFAACMLMPRDMVLSAWKARFGDTRTRVAQPGDDAQIQRVCRELAEPLAQEFVVSVEAMRIRLEQLGLLHRAPPVQRLLRSVS